MFEMLFVNLCHPLSACISTLDSKCRNMSNTERADIKEKIEPNERDTCSGGMNGYISLCGGEPCPPIFRSPIAGMEDIMDNHVICAIFRLPDVHEHITRPPPGVKFPKKIVTLGDLQPEAVPWHEDNGRRYNESGRKNPMHEDNGSRRYTESGRKNPPGSISGGKLGEAAHRLVANSLQVSSDANRYHHPNGSTMPFNGPRGYRHPHPNNNYESRPGHNYESRPGHNYESRPGYAAALQPPLLGPPQYVPYAAPTVQYGYNQPYTPPVIHSPHQHQSNSFPRGDHQNPRSHHYERNNHHGNGGNPRHSTGNNQNPRFTNTQGSYPRQSHHDSGRHSQNFQPYRRGSDQHWTPRGNPSGYRDYGQHSANHYSLLDRGAGKNNRGK